MKVRDSGMPDEEIWSRFFNPERILRAFGLDHEITNVVEFGCGYGTFTYETAKMISGTLHAFDIEPDMVASVVAISSQANIRNIHAEVRDFVEEGTGLPKASMDATLLFNILHHDNPVTLLKEAHGVLNTQGCLAIIHWNYDPATPRGPAMEIRPYPEQCIEWCKIAGFSFDEKDRLDLPPYHYGLLLRKLD